MAKVIATGGVPGGSLWAQAGAQAGQGLGQGLGGLVGRNMAERRLARQLTPFSEMFSQELQGVQNPTLQQQMLAQMAQDPRAFAQLTGGVQGAFNLAGQIQPQAEPFKQRVVLSGSSERNKQFNLGIPDDQQAIVEFIFDRQGGTLTGANVITEPDAGPGSSESGLFGNSLQGRTLSYMAELAPDFAEAKTTPEQERTLLTAVTNYMQPEQYNDPDTGLVVTRRKELPGYVRQALQKRGFQVGEEGIAAPAGYLAQPSPQEQARNQQIEQSLPTLPGDVVPVPIEQGQPSMWEIVENANPSGPIGTIKRGIQYVAGGEVGAREVEAATEMGTIKNRIVKLLQQNPRYATTEAERINREIDVDPSALRQGGSIQSALVGLDESLERIQNEMDEVVSGRRALVSGETRQHAMDTLTAIQYWRPHIAPPRVKPEQLQQFAQTAAPGAKVLIDHAPGRREIAYVFQRSQDAERFAETAEPGTIVVVNGERFEVYQ